MSIFNFKLEANNERTITLGVMLHITPPSYWIDITVLLSS
jgi:hypothetical protein